MFAFGIKRIAIDLNHVGFRGQSGQRPDIPRRAYSENNILRLNELSFLGGTGDAVAITPR
jgi:hypothetical protein